MERARNISTLKRKWTNSMQLACLLYTIAVTMLICFPLIRFYHMGYIIFPVVFILSGALFYATGYKNIQAKDVITFLNHRIPALEESAGLIIRPFDTLNFLERLQLNKITPVLSAPMPVPDSVRRNEKRALAFLFIVTGLCIAQLFIPEHIFPRYSFPISTSPDKITPAEHLLPQINEVSIHITPPLYTRNHSRETNKLNIVAEQGAMLNWRLETTASIKALKLLFHDKSVVTLQPTNKAATEWKARKQLQQSGFYQVMIDGTLSELYKLEMIKDQPPVILIQSPKPLTVIEPGQSLSVTVNTLISDDYGIKQAFLTATIASGSGEAVKFKEQQMSFPGFNGGRRIEMLKKIDLLSLGMRPGDELYFYVLATDNYNQEKRSDVFIVRIEDTTQLMSMEGLASGTNIKPEFFRSQRQIIIETEQLLKSRDTISVDAFNKKSNDLGVDQKLLRLRYGKFLGEETNAEIGNGHDHEEGEHDEAESFGNADKMMEEVAHNHDNAEDASFFDPATKKQLKATLAEMWKAELQLRTLKPKDALPFEYRALKLLKELQQQTRVYVAKTGIKTTPLNPGKRLTGELDKIIQPVTERRYDEKKDAAITVRKALGMLEALRNKERLPASSMQTLQEAAVQLSAKAAAEPSVYLSSLQAVRRIIDNKYKPEDLAVAGRAFQRMINQSSKFPHNSDRTPDMKLSERYFQNLKRRQ